VPRLELRFVVDLLYSLLNNKSTNKIVAVEFEPKELWGPGSACIPLASAALLQLNNEITNCHQARYQVFVAIGGPVYSSIRVGNSDLFVI